jgi:hypothetical protein
MVPTVGRLSRLPYHAHLRTLMPRRHRARGFGPALSLQGQAARRPNAPLRAPNVWRGGEATLANGDAVSEGMLNDIGVPTKSGVRVPLVESVFEYGSRRGAWRVLDIRASSKRPIGRALTMGSMASIRNDSGFDQFDRRNFAASITCTAGMSHRCRAASEFCFLTAPPLSMPSPFAGPRMQDVGQANRNLKCSSER